MNHLVDAEVFADVDHPATEPSSSSRFAADVVSIEVGVAQEVLLDPLNTLHRRIILVKRNKGLEEGIHVSH